MKKTILLWCACLFAVSAMAVPAKPGARDFVQPNGEKIQIYVHGDETYHFTTDKDGNMLTLNEDGYYVQTGEQADNETIQRRRANGRIRRSAEPRRVGSINLAPRGLFILVNFSNATFNSSNSLSAMNDMLNKEGYNYGGAPGSVKDYFIAQSNGQYNPQFDVYGPVTLTHPYSYYGANDSSGNDKQPEQMVIEACQALDSQIDFSLYDGDNDGEIDFVYVIYAGKGEADGGAASTIWPHQWFIKDGAGLSVKLDGKYLNNYACGPELNGQTGGRNGIGTLCHEFGHVLGLPDYYDTNYSTNYNNGLTPNEWSIMDAGSYNNDGVTPPNWSAHDKFYVGWYTPEILNSAENVTLPADGQTYRCIKKNGKQPTATTTDTVFYIENRQQSGWDKYLPGHGMVVWKVVYSQSVWENNEPNNTANKPRFTVVSASGNTKNIGNSESYNNYDPFPGAKSKTSWTPYKNYPVTDIKESNNVITFKFMGGVVQYTVTFDAGIGTCTTKSLKESATGSGITLPEATAPEGYTFLGWATTSTAAVADAGEAGARYYPTKNITLYAVYLDNSKTQLVLTLYGAQLQGETTTDNTITKQITKGEDVDLKIVARECYLSLNRPTSEYYLYVVIGGEQIEAETSVTEDGVLSVHIDGSLITDVVRLIIRNGMKISIYASVDNATITIPPCVDEGETVTATLVPNENYTLTIDDILITMNGSDVVAGTGFTYDNNILTIPNVTGYLEIVAVAQRDLPEGTLSVAQALALIEQLGQGEQMDEQVTVQGYVTSIPTKYSSQYKNITLNIGDTKDATEVLMLYRAKPEQNSDINVTIGDLVVCTGYLYRYYSMYSETETFEMAAGCVYSIVTDEDDDPKDPDQPTGDYYEKITQSLNEWSGTYLIVCEDKSVAFDGSLTVLDVVGNTIDVTITDQQIPATNATRAAEFTIERASNTTYTIKSASGFYIGNASDKNALTVSATDAMENSIYISNHNVDIIGKGGAYLRYNSTTNQTRFRYYKSSTYDKQQAIQLYRLVESPVTGINEATDSTAVKAQKFLENGRIVIVLPNGKRYNMLGMEM